MPLSPASSRSTHACDRNVGHRWLNWNIAGTTLAYANGNIALFNDTSTNRMVDIVGTLTPVSLTVNSTGNYSLGSTSGGLIGGSTSLTKSGAGTLTLSTENTYTGGTVVNGGTLSVNTIADTGASALGNTGKLSLSGGKLTYTGSSAATTTREVSILNSTIELNNGNLALNGKVAYTANTTLTKTGGGTLTLGGTADNSYLLLDAKAGVVELGKTSNVSAVAGISGIANGATVILTGTGGNQIYDGSALYGVNGLVAGGTLNLNGNSESIAVLNGTGGIVDAGTGTPTLTLGTSNGSSIFGGVIQNSGGSTLSLVKNGTGSITLASANTYNGPTTVNAGALGVQKSATSSITVAANAGLGLVIGDAAGYTIPDVETLLGGGSLDGVTLDPASLVGIDTTLGDLIYSNSPVTTRGFAKTGINTLTLTGNNASTFGAGATVYAGVLSLANTAAKPSGPVTVNGGAGLALGVSPTNEAGFYTTADVNALWSAANGVLVNGVTMNGTSLVGIDTTQGDLSYTAPASTRGLAKVGSNILTLTGANAYTGGTLVGAGRLVLVDTATGSPNFTTNADLEFKVTTGVQRLSAWGTIKGTGNLIKTGAGNLQFGWWNGLQTIALTGANSMIHILEGSITQSDGNSLWGSNLAGMHIESGANFTIGNGSASVDELTGSGRFACDQGGLGTLTIGVNNGSGTFSGSAPEWGWGQQALVKQGTGTQTLSGPGLYLKGGVTVNGGRLVMLDITAGIASFTTNAELEFNVTTGTRQLNGGTFSGSGKLIKTGAGVLMLGGSGSPQTMALTSGSLIDVQGGVLRNEYGNSAWGGNKADLNVAFGTFFDIWDGNTVVDAITGDGTINKGYSFNNSLTIGADNGSGIFSGTISQGSQTYGGSNGGAFSLIKIGSGIQTLSGACSYGGSTTINGGTLALGDDDILPGTAVSIGNATLDAGIATDTVGTLDVTAAAKINLGDNAKLIFANSNEVDWTGGTLNITGSFVSGSSIKFTNSSGLTTGQLDQISINGNSFVDCTLDESGYLVATSSDPYLIWAIGNEPFDGDANGDGVQDGLAWILNSATPATNALDKLPQPSKDGSFLTLDFERVNPYAPTKLFVEFGNALGEWTVVEIPMAAGTIDLLGDDVVVEVTSGSPDLVKVKIPTSYQSASGALFARLRATSN